MILPIWSGGADAHVKLATSQSSRYITFAQFGISAAKIGCVFASMRCRRAPPPPPAVPAQASGSSSTPPGARIPQQWRYAGIATSIYTTWPSSTRVDLQTPPASQCTHTPARPLRPPGDCGGHTRRRRNTSSLFRRADTHISCSMSECAEPPHHSQALAVVAGPLQAHGHPLGEGHAVARVLFA
jgi:hypothetical protein